MLAKIDRLSSTMYRIAGANQRGTSGPLTRAGEYLHDVFEARLLSESGYNGQWKGLEDSTMRDREKLGYGREHPILYRKGSLLRAATGNFNTNNRWSGLSYKGTEIKSVWKYNDMGTVGLSRAQNSITQWGLTVGVESEYIKLLHDGGGPFPSRSFIYINRENERFIRGIYRDWINDVIRRAGI